MLIVECTNDNWILSEETKKIVDSGGEIPVVGKKYTVSEHTSYNGIPNNPEFEHLRKANISVYDGYVLKEIDWAKEFNTKISWNANNFKIIEDIFVPNGFLNNGLVEYTRLNYGCIIDTENLDKDEEMGEVWIHKKGS